MSLRDILFIIFFKIHVIVGVFIIVLAAAAWRAFTTPPVYSAAAYVLIKPFVDSRKEVFLKNAFRVDSVSQEYINTELKILNTRELVLDVIKKLNLKPAPPQKDSILVRLGISTPSTPLDHTIKYVKKKLEFSPVTMSYIIRIKKQGSDPEMITKIVNTYLDCYMERHIEVYKSTSEVKFFKSWINRNSKELDEANNALREKQKKWNIIDIERQNANNITLLQILKEKFSRVKIELAEKKQVIKSLQKDIKENNIFSTMPEIFRKNDALSELQRIYAPLLIEREKIANLYNENTAEREDIERVIRKTQKNILLEQKKILNGLITDVEGLEAKRAAFTQYIDKIKQESRFLADNMLEYKDLEIRLDQARESYKLYLNRLENALIDEQRDILGVSNISVVSRAHQPGKPEGPKRKFILVVGAVAGTIAGIGTGFAAYYIDHTVKTPEDLFYLTKAPVISSLEKIKT